jgi:hypothetical protein
MKNLMRTALIAVMLAAGASVGASVANAQVSFGIRIGPPPAPRVIRVHPPRPGPDYLWVDGYWYPVGGHYQWHEGYWTRAAYEGARWVGPHYEGGQFFDGYWGGDRGRVEHHHDWDRDHDRDYHRYDRDHDHDGDHGHDRDGDHH